MLSTSQDAKSQFMIDELALWNDLNDKRKDDQIKQLQEENQSLKEQIQDLESQLWDKEKQAK